MKKKHAVTAAYLLMLSISGAAIFSCLDKTATGAHYSAYLLPLRQWTIGFEQTEIIVDGNIHGKTWSAPCGWVLTLGFFQVDKQDNLDRIKR